MKSTSCSSHKPISRSSSGLPVVVADVEPRHAELLGQAAAVVAVADHQPRLRFHVPVADRPQQRERWLRPERGADRQPWLAADDVRASRCESKVPSAGPLPRSALRSSSCRPSVELDAREHREQALGVVVVHLDLGDVRPQRRDAVDDRIGQAATVRPHRRDDDL